VRFEYNNSPYDTATSSTGSATVTNANSMAICTTGSGIGSATIRSDHTVVYHPAHEIYAYFTAIFTENGDDGSYQRIGLFDDNDGFGLGFEGSTFGVFKRAGGTQTTTIQANFNKNRLDGSKGNDEKHSRFNLDHTKMNIFRIAYGWLGIAPCEFSVYGGQDRGWITFHVIDESNKSTQPTIDSPSAHMNMEAGRSASSGNAISISTGSWSAGGTGERSTAGHRHFTQAFTKTVAANSTTYLGTISNVSTYQGKTNKIPLILTHIGISTEGTKPAEIKIIKDAVLVDTSASSVNANSSIVSVDTSGSASAGTVVMPFPMAKADTLGEDLIEQNLMLHPSETFTITGNSTASNDVEVTLRWRENHA
jgi:hypothetical protein